MVDPEPLLLVNNQQAEVAETDIFLQKTVGADADVNLARSQSVDNLILLFWRFKAAQHFDSNREGVKSPPEGGIVLLGEHGGGHQHRHLPVIHHRLEGRPYGDLCLAVADVAADEAVHRFSFLHVPLDVMLRLHLVGRLDIGKRGLHLLLPERVAGKSEARYHLPGGVQSQQLLGKVFGGLFSPLLGATPLLRAQPA
ncbi:hypothetical protein ES707_18499 [subsurface metagenome]